MKQIRSGKQELNFDSRQAGFITFLRGQHAMQNAVAEEQHESIHDRFDVNGLLQERMQAQAATIF